MFNQINATFFFSQSVSNGNVIHVFKCKELSLGYQFFFISIENRNSELRAKLQGVMFNSAQGITYLVGADCFQGLSSEKDEGHLSMPRSTSG